MKVIAPFGQVSKINFRILARFADGSTMKSAFFPFVSNKRKQTLSAGTGFSSSAATTGGSSLIDVDALFSSELIVKRGMGWD